MSSPSSASPVTAARWAASEPPAGAGIAVSRISIGKAQPVADFRAAESCAASSADNSTTRRPPPSSGTRITMPRPSFVTSSGPSPVRGFIAAILHPLSCPGPHEGLRRGPPPGNAGDCGGFGRFTAVSIRTSIIRVSRPDGNDQGLLGPQLPGETGETGGVNARSALFDLYGDHLRSRGSQAPVAALVRLLAPLGITEPAARTAVSRMVRQGWLAPVRCGPGLAGYALTPRAARRLDEAAERIYRRGDPAWDGRWHVLVIERIRDRARRDRVRAALGYLGYAPLGETTWISPRPSVELDPLLEAERLPAERFVASYDGDPRGLLARAWDLDGLGRAYQRWLAAGARADRGGRPGRARPGGLRAAQRAGPRVAQVPVHRPGVPRGAAAPGLARATRRRGCSTPNRRGCCRARPGSWTAA